MVRYRFRRGDLAYLADGHPVRVLAVRTQTRTARYTVLFFGKHILVDDQDLYASPASVYPVIGRTALAHAEQEIARIQGM